MHIKIRRWPTEMPQILERHRVPLGPQFTLIYHRLRSERSPVEVTCSFRLGYANGTPGQIYALMKAFQAQYPNAWRPRLTLTPDWSQLHFVAATDYRRELDEQWLRLFELESALTPLEPLLHGLLQEQRWHQESAQHLLNQSFQQLAFAGSAYDRQPLGQPEELSHLGQTELLEAYETHLQGAAAWIQISDHQPLHLVLERLRPLLQKSQVSHPTPPALPLRSQGLRESRLNLSSEGGWLYAGLTLPGLDQPQWIYGPLLQAWLEQVWQEAPATPELHLLAADWQAWQRASLLCLRLHTHQPQELHSHKQALIHWLAGLRQHYLTSRRMKQAVAQCVQRSQASPQPLYVSADERLSGWGHCRQRWQQVTLAAFQQAVEHYLNADHLLLQVACPEQVNLRHLPDYRKDLHLLGFAPAASAPVAPLRKYQELQRLHLGPEHTAWVVPIHGLSQLELGLWFASGAAQDPVPGLSSALMQLLQQRFSVLLEQQDGKGAWRGTQTWLSGVQPDACFFKWAVSIAELPQALQLLNALLQDLPLEAPTFQAFRQARQTELLSQELEIWFRAQTQFARSGFANHPYGQPLQGDYLSLRQWNPSLLQARWRELRQQGVSQPLLLGAVPATLQAEQLAAALTGLLPAQHLPQPLPPVRTRRGEIIVKTSHLGGFRFEGQVLPEPLPLEQQMAVQVAAQWLQDRTRSRLGLPLQHQLQFLRGAWSFAFSGLYTKAERQHWLQAGLKLDTPLNTFKQRLQADLRLRQQQSQVLWPELIHWLSLGGSPGAFLDRERELLALSAEQLEQSLLSLFTHEQDWLQIVFQPADNKIPAWGKTST